MNRHPALTMLATWGLCAAAWTLLPYQLIGRQFSIDGTLLMAAFVMVFLIGSLLLPGRRRICPDTNFDQIDAGRALMILALASVVASVCFLMDARDKNLFDLELAYETRSEAADALLKGEASNSSAWFQLGFLFYPAGFVYTALHIVYAKSISLPRIALLGLLPIGLATLGMGGRVPIFYAMLVVWLALQERRKYWAGAEPGGSGPAPMLSRWTVRLLLGMAGLVLFAYFASVFMVRAEVVGGARGMFEVAEDRWGIGFGGALSPLVFGLLGENFAYLLFVFVWYLVQGFVMGNIIFSEYDGPMQMGVYGLDLMSALMRRVAPDSVAQGFDALMELGTYGFLPSAWGSLYVDLGLLGLFASLLWGLFAALAYKRIVVQQQARWLIVGPFVTLGIVFSVINTPLGFTNGLVTHLWLLAAFFLLRRGAASKALVSSPRVGARPSAAA
jgi:hypothetical protein